MSLTSSTQPSSSDLTPRQQRICRSLLTQIGPGPEKFFRDACMLRKEQPAHAAVTHLVAHMYREVESALRSIMEPPGAADGVRSNGHEVRIRATLLSLGIPESDSIAVWWLAMAGQSNPEALNRRAHRSSLDQPRPVDEGFDEFCERFETVVDVVLEKFEGIYYQIFERIDALLGKTQPAVADAKSFRNNFPVIPAVQRHFFSRASAVWLQSLRQAGYFVSPPPPIADESAQRVEMPVWYEAEFLARVAADDPEGVIEVAKLIPVTDNARVGHALTEMALSTPAATGARLVGLIVAYGRQRYGMLSPERVGVLAAHLGQGGEHQAALKLVEEVLRYFLPVLDQGAAGNSYEYTHVLREHVPGLARTAGLPVLSVLVDHLRAVVEEAGRLRRQLWRPSIAAGPGDNDPRQVLVDSVRDAAVVLIAEGTASVEDVVGVLEADEPAPLLRRMAFYVLAQYADTAQGLVRQRLTDRDLFADRRLHPEHTLLLAKGRGILDLAERRRVLDYIDAGPDLGPRSSNVEALSKVEEAAVDDAARATIGRWQRDHLAALEPILPAPWAARYRSLVAEMGPPTVAASGVAEVVDVGGLVDIGGLVESPVSADELSVMPTSTLVEFLRTWQPAPEDQDRFFVVSPRSALTTAVQRDASSRSAEAARFIGLESEYIDGLLNGLSQGLKAGAALNWTEILRLGAWVNQQALDELDNAPNQAGYRRTWRSARLTLLMLLMAGLNQQPSPVPADTDTALWSIIASACEDPDPAPADEVRETQQRQEFMSLALNSVRPLAIRAAISYGLWLRRRETEQDLAAVLQLLDRHLDPQQDPSSAVRTIYGELFASLQWMSPDWATRKAARIFPLQPDQRLHLDASWGAYLEGNRFTQETWTLLAPQYQHAIDHIDPTNDDRAQIVHVQLLGHHLIRQYWLGNISLHDPDHTLHRFYTRAPAAATAQISSSIGQSLINTPTPLPDGLVPRLRDLWEYRIGTGRAMPAELAGFAGWFISGVFDGRWSLEQLLLTWTGTDSIRQSARVLPRVAELAPTHTLLCLTFLETWVRREPEPWVLPHAVEPVRTIVRAGLAGDADQREIATRIIGLLLRDGHGLDLRDLLHPED
jgi:hypothetical protein